MKKQIFYIIIAITVIGLGFGGWYYFSPPRQESQITPTPNESSLAARSLAEKILKLLQNRDYGKVYDLLTDEDKAAESRTEYVKRVTKTSGAITIISWQIKEVLEEQDGASVQYVVNYANPAFGSGSETGILTLVQKNGKWFLSVGAVDIKKAAIKGVGDEIELATVKYKVNKVEEKLTLTSRYGEPKSAKENTKFVVIDMSITNTTKNVSTFPYSHEKVFTIIDNRDRQFSSYDGVYAAVDNYLDGRKLSPSITERGVLIYEIPEDATTYALVSVKAGTNEVYKVILK